MTFFTTAMNMAGKALAFLLVMTLLCGVVYPLVTTGLAQLFFHKQAKGAAACCCIGITDC